MAKLHIVEAKQFTVRGVAMVCHERIDDDLAANLRDG